MDQAVLARLRATLQVKTADPRAKLAEYLSCVAQFRLDELGSNCPLDQVRLDALADFVLLDQATLTVALVASWTQGRLDQFEHFVT